MSDIKVNRHSRRKSIRVYTREDARPILMNLEKIIGGPVVDVELVGSVARRGKSEKDIDILVVLNKKNVEALDPKLGPIETPLRYRDEVLGWLHSEDPRVIGLINKIHHIMSKSGCRFIQSIDGTDVFLCGKKIPVELFYGELGENK